MSGRETKASTDVSGRLRFALRVIGDLDGYRNLRPAVPGVVFIAAGAFALRSFFWLIDVGIWLKLDTFAPVLPSMIAFLLLFVVWMFSFLMVMTAFAKAKFGDIDTLVRNRLSELELSARDLRELKMLVRSKTWKHDRILNRAVASLHAESEETGVPG